MDPASSVPTLVAGGTAGLILGLVIAVWALATRKVRPGADVEDADKRVAAEAERTEKALAVGAEATKAVTALTDEMRQYRILVEELRKAAAG